MGPSAVGPTCQQLKVTCQKLEDLIPDKTRISILELIDDSGDSSQYIGYCSELTCRILPCRFHLRGSVLCEPSAISSVGNLNHAQLGPQTSGCLVPLHQIPAVMEFQVLKRALATKVQNMAQKFSFYGKAELWIPWLLPVGNHQPWTSFDFLMELHVPIN